VGVVGGIVRRAIVPAALVIAGMAALVEGFWHHPIPVLVERETKKTIDVPLPLPPGPALGGSFLPGMPFGGPSVVKKTITQIELAPLVISEPDATRDVTIGGLERLASGEQAGQLKRTYTGSKGPALCPT
jgi:hypothetical protein